MTVLRKHIRQRKSDPDILAAARTFGLTELQSRIVANRAGGFGKNMGEILFPALQNLHHPELLKDCAKAAERIAGAVLAGERIGILTDYDVDGICSHVVAHQALTGFGVRGERLASLIGHRMHDGYGMSRRLVDRILALEDIPRLIITADCGSSDEEEIKRLGEAGVDVIVTDHHEIPEEGVPASAHATINPTRHDCGYPDKFVSGCMVCWLLMCAVRLELIRCGRLGENAPRLGHLLDFVCLSTVADAVSLISATNRAVIVSGLEIINQLTKPAWFVLAGLLGKDTMDRRFTVEDLAFQVGPRINARSRMADPYAALYFFLSDNMADVRTHLEKLNKSNEERKVTEREMVERANVYARELLELDRKSLVISDPSFHAGVQGIVATRLMESFGRPVVVLSPMADAEILSGSARTIPEIHIRNILQKVADSHPGILLSFGGHQGAAGLKIREQRLAEFYQAFEKTVCEEVNGREMKPLIYTDGSLDADRISLNTVAELSKLEPYGREFDEPLFEGYFTVIRSRMVGADPIHLSLELEQQGRHFTGIWFRAVDRAGEPQPINNGNSIRCVYKLKLNNYRGKKNLQLIIEYAEIVDQYIS